MLLSAASPAPFITVASSAYDSTDSQYKAPGPDMVHNPVTDDGTLIRQYSYYMTKQYCFCFIYISIGENNETYI